jgi:DNA-binding MarR family transcriptional regulator|tara:strand:- start:36 stop:992 length:957 start_codon:yes stop_codon:yes gene_type:complete
MSAESILQLISSRGPQVPTQIAQAIGTDSIIASAHLSELSSRGKVKISRIKVGSSPLYYLPGQEEKLQDFVENLHDKEKKAYDLLSEEKIVRDIEQEPVIRVALRDIKDFAVPLEVQRGERKEIFWKWFLLSSEEAQVKITELLAGGQEGVVKPEVEREEVAVETEVEPAEMQVQKEDQETLVVEQPAVKESVVETPIAKPKVQIKTTPAPKTPKEDIDFSGIISEFFSSNEISISKKEVLKKTEIDYVVKIPSAVGEMEYYCKTRKKKSINDADLASAFAQGQLRKLPVLFLTTGKLTKRAKEMLESDFKGIQVREL